MYEQHSAVINRIFFFHICMYVCMYMCSLHGQKKNVVDDIVVVSS